MSDSYQFTQYENKLSLRNKLARFLWNIVWLLLFRPFMLKFFNKWRMFILRSFGAKIGKNSIVHSTVKVWAPWNLSIGDFTCIGPYVECYTVNKIIIGSKVTVSQYVSLYTASHDISIIDMPLITSPIKIEDMAWVAAQSYIGMGVTIHKGAVVGARASVFKDVAAWTIVGGNPAKYLKKRELK